ncbi:hypothetical protein NP493_1567g00020 [Ridgeia piscesae]|uniref:Chitin-binding type-2 domain-containing protein n=1 Tax=Ridgeia piscesae TaxID=27915 RepID=A0AAD9JZ11_RIDPI|nr:hypothetical protein NP493_1567g00020 [Ridgeia piscesae]
MFKWSGVVAALFTAIVLCYSADDKCEELCDGKPDGMYASSCNFDCRHYVICFFGFSFKLKCRPDHYFDVEARKCVKECPTGPRGIVDCAERKDGLYQHCCFCDMYVTCANYGLFFHSRCGVGGPVWDDDAHKCLWNSTTCDKHVLYDSAAR